jgi:DNA-binding MarR family transcriptional regulator
MLNIDHRDNVLRVFILFVQTARAVLKYADSHFYERARLSTVKFVVLQALAANGGTMNATQIADWTNTERHNITTLLERMKRDGLVTVERKERDKRFLSIRVTDKGRAVLREARPAAWEIVNQVMASIGDGDAASLEKVLRVLRQNTHRGLERLASSSR